jgi:hypothetical protein
MTTRLPTWQGGRLEGSDTLGPLAAPTRTSLEHGEGAWGAGRSSRATSDRPGDTRHPDLRLSSGTKIRPPEPSVDLSLKRPRDMTAGLLGNKVQRVTNLPAPSQVEHAVAGYGAPRDQLLRDNQLGSGPRRNGTIILHLKALPNYMLNAT